MLPPRETTTLVISPYSPRSIGLSRCALGVLGHAREERRVDPRALVPQQLPLHPLAFEPEPLEHRSEATFPIRTWASTRQIPFANGCSTVTRPARVSTGR